MTNEALARWLDRLEGATLPALGHTVEVLDKLTANENSSINALAEQAQRDPGLTLHLLRNINAVRQRHLHTEITTVAHGMMMLGLSPLREQLGSVTLVESVQPGPVRRSLLRTFCRSYHAAYQAWDWACLRHDKEPDELFTAALLHPLGEMLLWLHAPAQMEGAQQLAASRGMDPEEAEYVVLGFGLDQLSLGLAERWALPELYRNSLGAENAAGPRIRGLMLAVRLAREAQFGWQRRSTRETIEEAADHLGQPVDDMVARVHANAARAARSANFHGVMPAAALLPGTDATAEAYPYREKADPAQFCLTPRPDMVDEAMREITSSSGRNASAAAIIEAAVRAMHEGAGLNRVVFASLSRNSGRLRAARVAGSENDPLFSGFEVDLADNPLLALVMKREQALWLNAENRDRFWALVPERFRHAVGTYSFFVMSVFVGNKAAGLFYADRHTDACTLDAAAYERFKQLGAAAARSLAAADTG